MKAPSTANTSATSYRSYLVKCIQVETLRFFMLTSHTCKHSCTTGAYLHVKRNSTKASMENAERLQEEDEEAPTSRLEQEKQYGKEKHC